MPYAGIKGCERMARNLMDVHGLSDWAFKWGNARSQIGATDHQRRTIRLSRAFAELWGPEGMRDTVLHEIAHALAGTDHGHDSTWRAICRRIGAKPERLASEDDGPAPLMRYTGTCPNGHTVQRQRLPRNPVSCAKCARRFDPRYLLTWTEN